MKKSIVEVNEYRIELSNAIGKAKVAMALAEKEFGKNPSLQEVRIGNAEVSKSEFRKLLSATIVLGYKLPPNTGIGTADLDSARNLFKDIVNILKSFAVIGIELPTMSETVKKWLNGKYFATA